PDDLAELGIERHGLAVGGGDDVARLEAALVAGLAGADRQQMRMDVRQDADVADLELRLLVRYRRDGLRLRNAFPQEPHLHFAIGARADRDEKLFPGVDVVTAD